MNNAWDTLPNAKYIDRLLAAVRANPQAFADNATRVAARNATQAAARATAARAATREATRATATQAAAREAARAAPKAAVWEAALGAVLDAVLALIAYDDLGALFDRPLTDAEALEALGDDRVLLLLPVLRAMEA